MLRTCLISNLTGYGEGNYGEDYYSGFSEVTIDDKWKFSKSINQMKQFSFTITNNPNSLTIQKGLEVLFVVDGSIMYSGIIQSVKPYEPTYGHIEYTIEALTYEKAIDKRLVGEVFENKTAGYILKYLINNYLYQEGFSIGTIQDGPTFDLVVFNYISIVKAINKVVSQCIGYNWRVHHNKQIDFIAKATFKSAYTLDDDFYHHGFYPSDTLDEYRNSQIIEGGRKETNVVTEWIPSPKPDGESRSFTVKFPIAREPVIEINVNGGGWVTQTVGINGIDTGKNFYWTYGSDAVVQDAGDTVLTDSNPTPDQIRITFYGLLDVRLWYEDTTKIAERAAIDGNSGKYENVFQNKDIRSNAAAVKYAQGLIEKYSDNREINLIVEDDIKDFDINMLVKVEKPFFGIDDWYLIEEIKASYQTPEHITYNIKMISGEFVGGWEDYFRAILDFVGEINAEDVIVRYKGISEIYTYSGQYNIEVSTLLAPSNSLPPSNSLSPGTAALVTTLYD